MFDRNQKRKETLVFITLRSIYNVVSLLSLTVDYRHGAIHLCVVCFEILSIEAMKRVKLARHLHLKQILLRSYFEDDSTT